NNSVIPAQAGIHVEAMTAFVCILASKPRGTLYVGVTNDFVCRIYEHLSGVVEGFTKRYGVHRRVYFETYDDIENSIVREKCIKKWNRAGKLGSTITEEREKHATENQARAGRSQKAPLLPHCRRRGHRAA